ncbi:MAG: hypothetical protein AAB229_06110 [Candidatus Hydrogenedentota bacterium]
MFEVAIVAAVFLTLLIVAALFIFKSGPTKEPLVLMRACPICGHELKIGENILAERTGVKKEGRERIVIKGCVHCLKRV